MDITQKHEKLLYPIVRVFSEKAAGSGTIIYSKSDPRNDGDYLSFVLTNYHVIESLITYKDEWDSLVKRKVEKEFKKKAKVEVFSYIYESVVDSSNRYNADVLAYDKHHDLAILRIDSPRKFEFTSILVPKNKVKDLRLYTDVVVSGCSMAHEPFSNFGQLTFLKEIIDEKEYVMTNASSVFGNSGGALFLADTGELIGVPSRISTIQMGFGYDVLTWMGFSAHPKRIYEFLDEQELKFLYDDSVDFYTCLQKREDKEKESLLALKAEFASKSCENQSRSGGDSLSE